MSEEDGHSHEGGSGEQDGDEDNSEEKVENRMALTLVFLEFTLFFTGEIYNMYSLVATVTTHIKLLSKWFV